MVAPRPIHPSPSRSGLSCIAVQIALAWISGPDIRLEPLVGVGWRSCRVGAEAPITTILPRTDAGSKRSRFLATRSANERVSKRAGTAAEVDPGPPVGEALRRRAVRVQALGRHDGDRRQPARGGLVAADDPALLGRQVGGGGPGVDGREHLVAAEHLRLALGVARARRQHGPSGAADGVVEREVRLAVRGRLRELDVVDDQARAGGVQPVDRARVLEAAERPAADLVDVVIGDLDDDDVARRRGVAHREARVDRVVLEALQDPGRRNADGGHDPDQGGRHRHEEPPCGG